MGAFRISKDACRILRHSLRKECSRRLCSMKYQVLYELAKGDPEHSQSASIFDVFSNFTCLYGYHTDIPDTLPSIKC